MSSLCKESAWTGTTSITGVTGTEHDSCSMNSAAKCRRSERSVLRYLHVFRTIASGAERALAQREPRGISPGSTLLLHLLRAHLWRCCPCPFRAAADLP